MNFSFPKFQGPFLVGDIGGTNARFSLLDPPDGREQVFETCKVSDFSTIEDVLEKRILPFVSCRPVSFFLAFAGPVESSRIALTNAHWIVDVANLIKRFDFKTILVINDFEAQALATATLRREDIRVIGDDKLKNIGTRVILGPGTGLGVAGLARIGLFDVPISGEGGHIDFAVRTARDAALFPHFLGRRKRVSAEEILSGRGLVNIYHAICKLDGKEVIFEHADAVTTAAKNTQNGYDNYPPAREAVSLFLTYLGRFAGDLALVFKAHGGVYIGGGIVPKIIELVDEKEFRKEFENKAPHQSLLAQIPTYIITHPRAALKGMGVLARRPKKFLLDYKNRIWNAEDKQDKNLS